MNIRINILFIWLIGVVYLTAQEAPHFGWHNDDRPQAWAVDLDGSTEYMSKSSPSNLDLNGAEMINKWSDRNFSSKDSLTWTSSGTHTIDTSSTDKRTGTYSGKLVATAAGDSTTNYIILPATSFTALEVGKKYTLEGWCRVATTGTKITAGCGTKWKQSGTLSTTPGTFTKFVYNFQATAAEVNQGIRVYVNQSDSLYLDDFSLTQAMDLMINVWANYNTLSASAATFSTALSATTYFASFVNTRQTFARLYDEATNISLVSPNEDINYGQWVLQTFIYRRSDSLVYLRNGRWTQNAFIANVGKILTGTLQIGRLTTLNNMNGYLGQVQIVRFNDIATESINPAAWYVQGLPSSYTNGTIVFEFNPKDGSSDANMLKDYSSSGNNLSGTNVTTADRVPANYPIR